MGAYNGSWFERGGGSGRSVVLVEIEDSSGAAGVDLAVIYILLEPLEALLGHLEAFAREVRLRFDGLRCPEQTVYSTTGWGGVGSFSGAAAARAYDQAAVR